MENIAILASSYDKEIAAQLTEATKDPAPT